MEQQREAQDAAGTGLGSAGGATGSTGKASGFADSVGATRTGSYDRKLSTEEQGVKERVGEKLDEGTERIGEAVHTGKSRLADQIQRVGDRLHERARHMEESGGVQGRASHLARRASETIDRSADYLRSHEVEDMRDDLENVIRHRPLLSIGIAAGAGFLLARLLRN